MTPSEHQHTRDCYDDPGPGHGPPALVCGLTEGNAASIGNTDALTLSSLRSLTIAPVGAKVLHGERLAARRALELIARLRAEVEALKAGAASICPCCEGAKTISGSDCSLCAGHGTVDPGLRILVLNNFVGLSAEIARLRAENAGLRGACEWVANDIEFAAPEEAARKYALWYGRLLDELAPAPGAARREGG